MDIFPEKIEFSIFVGKSPKKTEEIKWVASEFHVDPATGNILYLRKCTKYMPNGESLFSEEESMFFVIRDLMAMTYSVICGERRRNPGCNIYYKSDGKLHRLESLSQLFLMDVAWDDHPA